MAREYRGWTIAVHSSEAEKGKWHPVVTVSVETRRAEILTRRLFTPSEWAFDSEQESDERGYLLDASGHGLHEDTGCQPTHPAIARRG